MTDLQTISCIISGGAKGADTLAENYARSRGIPIQVFKPNYERFGEGAPLRRNITIIDKSDVVVAFWDGRSKGTANALKHARELKKMVLVVAFD